MTTLVVLINDHPPAAAVNAVAEVLFQLDKQLGVWDDSVTWESVKSEGGPVVDGYQKSAKWVLAAAMPHLITESAAQTQQKERADIVEELDWLAAERRKNWEKQNPGQNFTDDPLQHGRCQGIRIASRQVEARSLESWEPKVLRNE